MNVIQQILKTSNGVIAPRSLKYGNAAAELARLEKQGKVIKLVHGYYFLVPEQDRKPKTKWRPSIEEIALGIAIQDYGENAVALIGPSASRALGLYPRPLYAATVAVPKQRPMLETIVGKIHFVKRDITNTQLTPVNLPNMKGFATSREETFIDLLRPKPEWPVSDSTRNEMIERLADLVDVQLVHQIAFKNRGISALTAYAYYKELLEQLTLKAG